MGSITPAAEGTVRPLTQLTGDEKMFQTEVRRFAREQIGPFVREMDEAAAFRKDLLGKIFEFGLMGIEIPEDYGGQGGTFFQSVIAVEEFAAVDPSAAVIVDVQNTLVNNALMRWASEEQKQRVLPRLAADTVGAYALSEAGAGSDACPYISSSRRFLAHLDAGIAQRSVGASRQRPSARGFCHPFAEVNRRRGRKSGRTRDAKPVED